MLRAIPMVACVMSSSSARKAANAARMRQRRAAKRLRGECDQCSEPARPGRIRCQRCENQNNARTRKHRYRIPPTEYDRRLQEQEGGCAICKKPAGERRLHIDHNHETGEVRGLLCLHCNTRLAVVEDPEFLARAGQYLRGENK